MHIKNFRGIIACLLALLLALPLAGRLFPASAYAVTQNDIEEVEREREQLAQKQQQTQSKIEQLKEQQASVMEQKAALDERNTLALEQLNLIKTQIELYTDLIREKELEVQQAKEAEETQLMRYRIRVRAMEENGGYDLLTLLIGAESFSELISAMDDINQIMEADRRLEDDYISAREEHEAVKAEYDATKRELEERQRQLDKEQKELEEMIAEATELIASLEEDIEKAIKEYEEAERARAAADYQISQLIAEINRQNAAIAAAKAQAASNAEAAQTEHPSDPPAEQPSDPPAEQPSDPPAEQPSDPPAEQPSDPPAEQPSDPPAEQPSDPPAETQPPESGNSAETGSDSGISTAGGSGVVGSGSLQWPVPSSHVVTSRYGMRIHPITGEEKYHSGMDIDGYNNEGGAIVACDDGVVVTASWYGGYGNCVIIDHGNGMQTLYGHMSGYAVGVGDIVTKGQTIGYLGSTGVATGTHCHLEVFVNGGRVDPAGYFSGITYYDC